MDANAAAIISGIVSGLLSGGLAAFAAITAYAHGYIRIETNEKRVAKTRLVDDLIAYRYALQPGITTEIDAHHFNKTIARVPYVFSDSKQVMEAYDEFSAFPNDTDRLIRLLQSATEAAGIRNGLPSRYVSKVFTIKPD